MALAQLGVGGLVGGRYVLEAQIGRGGMGEVWRARHVALASPVAIKFLHAASAASESSRRRFLTEAQVTANLRSRYAVQVFDFGVTEAGLPYLVMELLEGETLAGRIAREGRLGVEVTARVLQKAARALARAHQLGIVHRDFKPENIMLVADEEDAEQVKVVDFGVAKLVGTLDETLQNALECATLPEGVRAPTSCSVSSSGLGTPYYMAPEQVHGSGSIGPAADVWAFGVVAYECLTGQRPFGGSTVGDLLMRVLMASPPRAASEDGAPEAFDAWFATACARNPEKRFRDVTAAVAALFAALSLPVHDASRVIDPTPMPFSSRASTVISSVPRASREPSSRRRLAGALAAAGALIASMALRDGARPVEIAPPSIAAIEADESGANSAERDVPAPPADVAVAAPKVEPEPVATAAMTAAPLPEPKASPRPHGTARRPVPRLPPLGL